MMLEIIRHSEKDILSLCKQFGVTELYLFGSAASSSFNPAKSDLDFAVRFSNDVPVEDMADHFFGLSEALENLFDRKVDLVSIPALKNPVFIDELNATKVQLYAA